MGLATTLSINFKCGPPEWAAPPRSIVRVLFATPFSDLCLILLGERCRIFTTRSPKDDFRRAIIALSVAMSDYSNVTHRLLFQVFGDLFFVYSVVSKRFYSSNKIKVKFLIPFVRYFLYNIVIIYSIVIICVQLAQAIKLLLLNWWFILGLLVIICKFLILLAYKGNLLFPTFLTFVRARDSFENIENSFLQFYRSLSRTMKDIIS